MLPSFPPSFPPSFRPYLSIGPDPLHTRLPFYLTSRACTSFAGSQLVLMNLRIATMNRLNPTPYTLHLNTYTVNTKPGGAHELADSHDEQHV